MINSRVLAVVICCASLATGTRDSVTLVIIFLMIISLACTLPCKPFVLAAVNLFSAFSSVLDLFRTLFGSHYQRF